MKTNQEESPHQTLGLLLGPGLPAFTTMRQEFLLSSPPDYVLLWQQPELGQKVTRWIHGRCSTLLGVVDTEMKGPEGHGHWTSNNPSHFLSGMRQRSVSDMCNMGDKAKNTWNTWNWGEQGMATGAGGARWLCWTTPCKNRATKVSTCSKNTKCYENIFLKKEISRSYSIDWAISLILVKSAVH